MRRKLLLLPAVLLMATSLAACGTKDSQGKIFKAHLNHEKVMMTPDYTASVKLTANKNATYTVENSKGDDIQSSRKTKTGKANIDFNKTGKYVVVAKSDNGHVTKKLPVTVKPYAVQLNKTTSSVGPLQFKIKTIKYEQLTKKKEPNNDALFNMDNYASLNKHYYQVTINYEVRNNGDKTVDPQLTMWTPTDDNGTEFQNNGSADSYFYDTVVGGSKIAPKSHREGTIYMISNDKFSVKNLKLNVGDIFANDDEQIGDSGVAQLN